MTVVFGHAWALFLLLPAALAAALYWRLRGHSGYWKLVCVVLPALAAMCWILAAAAPTLARRARARHFVVLLDLSGSSVTAPWRKPAWVRAQLRNLLPRGSAVAVVGFAGHAREIFDKGVGHRGQKLTWPRSWPRFVGRRTDLARALAYNPPGFSADAPRWIFADGLLTWPPAPSFAAALTIVPPARPDVGVTGLQTFSTTAAGQRKLAIITTLHATGATHATIRLFRNKQLVARRTIQFSSAAWRTVRVLDAPVTNHGRTYRVDVVSADPWPRDNVAEVWAPAPGITHVLLVAGRRSGFLATGRHFRINRVRPRNFPLRLAQLYREQIVVLLNVPRSRLTAAARALLRRYVAATGGGLLLIGAQHAFGPGGYAVPGGSGAATLEALSPLSCLPPTPPPKQVVFLLDGSGSMGESAGDGESKFALAAASARRALGLLPAKQPCAILMFHNRARILLHGPAAEVRGKIKAAAARVIPTGATILNSALPLLQHLLRPRAEVILLTDGQIPHIAVGRWVALLRQRNAHLDIIAPLKRTAAKPTALARLAQATHAAVAATGNPRQWPMLVTRSLARRLAGRAHRRKIAWQGRHGPALHGVTHVWVRTWQKRRSVLWAASATGNIPLAATWHAGLGRVGAVAFLSESAAYGRLISGIMTAVKAPDANRRFTVAVRPRGRYWRIMARAKVGHEFLNGRTLELETAGGGRREKVMFRQVAPGAYSATILRRRQPLAGTVSELRQGRPKFVGRIAFPRLPGREWPATAPHEPCPWPQVTLLPTHGAVRPHRWRPLMARPPLPLRLPLLLLGAALALAALALRGKTVS